MCCCCEVKVARSVAPIRPNRKLRFSKSARNSQAIIFGGPFRNSYCKLKAAEKTVQRGSKGPLCCDEAFLLHSIYKLHMCPWMSSSYLGVIHIPNSRFYFYAVAFCVRCRRSRAQHLPSGVKAGLIVCLAVLILSILFSRY